MNDSFFLILYKHEPERVTLNEARITHVMTFLILKLKVVIKQVVHEFSVVRIRFPFYERPLQKYFSRFTPIDLEKLLSLRPTE